MEASTFDEAYCYKGTEVLKNNFNERDPRVLSQLERMYTGARIIDLLKKPLDGNFDIAHLKKIHHYIFQDIYPWAGTIRTVNISKEILFCDAQYIEKELNKIFLQLKQEQYLKNCTDKDIAKRAAYYLGEINAIHPFREGNGRTERIFISQLIRFNGYDIDFSDIDTDYLMFATIQSAQGITDNLVNLFKENII